MISGHSIAEAPAHVLCGQLDLAAAWQRVEGRAGMPGSDGLSIRRFGRTSAPFLRVIESRLASGSYRPLPLRLAEMEKKNGTHRMLLIPAVFDRVAMGAAANWMASRLNPAFDSASFGYRTGFGVRDALLAIGEARSAGYRWVLDADIQAFFDSIDHQILLDHLRHWLGPASPLTEWCRRWIQAEVWDGERTGFLTRGVPQGSPLSPILANLFLDEFDQRMRKTTARLVRYADDFVLLARTPFDLEKAQAHAVECLHALGLELSTAKTRVTSFDRGFRFLGAEIRGNQILLPLDKPKVRKKAVYVAPVMPRTLLNAWRAGHVKARAWQWVPHVPPEPPPAPQSARQAALRHLTGSPSLRSLAGKESTR